jgi:hypothetical protein
MTEASGAEKARTEDLFDFSDEEPTLPYGKDRESAAWRKVWQDEEEQKWEEDTIPDGRYHAPSNKAL